MQPNQQGTPTPQSASNVPDYLHMEPVADPVEVARNQRKKFFSMIAIIVIVIILAVGAVIAYIYFTFNSPQEKLYRALEKNMTVSYLSREYDIKSTNPNRTVTYSVDSDYSTQAQPKSKLTYAETRVKSDAVKVTYAGEKIILNDYEYFSTIKQITPREYATNEQLNVWIQKSLNDSSQYNFDGTDLLRGLNSIQGVVITGNFSSDQRKELVELIRTNNIYPVSAHQSYTENNRQLTAYTVGVDLDNINILNKKALNLIGINQYMTIAKNKKDKGELRVFVDDASEKIFKTTYTIKSNDTVSYEKVTTFNVLPQLTITKPATVNNDMSLKNKR